jgi:transposase
MKTIKVDIIQTFTVTITDEQYKAVLMYCKEKECYTLDEVYAAIKKFEVFKIKLN